MRASQLPQYVEVKPGEFRSIFNCAYFEFVEARELEKDRDRRRELDRLWRLNGKVWKSFPSMTVGDMIKQQ